MAKFKPYKITSSQLENLAKSAGQFIVTTDTQKIYLDESNSNRIELSPSPTKTSDLVNDMNFMSGMTILAYGKSTWNDFITAYTAKHVVYTRASSGSNPASGSQTRMAFMAYVNNETNPTEVEFQYYRSVSSHSDSQQGDQTYIYKLNKTNGWSVTVRENYTKVVAGTGMSSTGNSGKITLNCTVTPPTKTSDLTNDSGFIDNTVNNLTNYPLTNSLSSVAFSGDYDDLSDKPTIPTVPTNVSAFTNDAGYITKNVNDLTNYTLTSNLSTVATSGDYDDLTNKPTLFSGDYDDLTNKPTIPTVNNATLTIQKNGTTVKTFTANANSDVTANITVPTKVSDLTNDSGYTTNTGTITGVSVNSTSVATSGVANITSVPASILTGAIPSAVTATTQSQGNNSTKIATTAYVDTAIDNLPEPMVFKGSLGTGGTITSLPTDGSANIGDTYKVITAGTYASKAAKVGDTFICLTKTSSANTWELIPSGDEPSGTVTSVTLKATSPIAIDSTSAITTSGTRTLSHANSGVTAGTYKSITVNETGHVTAGTNPTTLSGYGITDAKIENGTITLGSNTITPLTNYTEINSNLVNGSALGSLRTFGSAAESSSYTIGQNAFAEGYNTIASGTASHVEGSNTKALGYIQHVQGKYNIEDTSNTYAHIVGNGTNITRSNAHTLDGSGNAWFAGDVYVGSTSGTNKDAGSKKLLKEGDVTDTKNTAGSTDTSNKIFLIGATSQATNPQTYSQDTAYVGTDGHLYSNSKQVVNLSDTQALTNKTYNGYTLAAAAAKGVDTSITETSTSTNLPTTAAVVTYVNDQTPLLVKILFDINTETYQIQNLTYNDIAEAIENDRSIIATDDMGHKTMQVAFSGPSSIDIVFDLINDAARDIYTIDSSNVITYSHQRIYISTFPNDSGYITSYTETDPIFTASAAYGITSTNITNWNGKQNQVLSGTTDPDNSLGENGDIYIKYSA